MEQLKNLQLTEKDFQLLVDGLDALPEKGMAGSLFVDLLGASMMKDGEDKEDFMRKRKIDGEKKDREKAAMADDIKILQGKLLMMKRYMIENRLIKESNDIVNP